MITQAEVERWQRLCYVAGHVTMGVICYRWPAHLMASKARYVRLVAWLLDESTERVDDSDFERSAFRWCGGRMPG